MLFVNAFGRLNRNLLVVLYPIILDLASFLLGLGAAGFYGQPGWSLRIILEMGLPSVGHLLNTPLFANRTEFLNHPAGIPESMWLAVVAMLLVSAFAQGGFIGSLLKIAEGEKAGFSRFIAYGRKSFLQFVFLYALFFLAKIALTALLAILFGYVGVFAAFLCFVVLRVAYIYLEFTIVADRVHLNAAFKKSWSYLKASLPETALVAGGMFLVSGALSLLMHRIWTPWIIVTGVLAYAYVMSGIQLAFMLVMAKTRDELKS